MRQEAEPSLHMAMALVQIPCAVGQMQLPDVGALSNVGDLLQCAIWTRLRASL